MTLYIKIIKIKKIFEKYDIRMNFLKHFSGAAMKERMKPLVAKYGKITIFTYLGISVVDLAFWYVVVQNGVDAKSIIKKIGIKVDDEKFKNPSRLGNFMIAVIIHKATVPIRLPISLACVPAVARVLGKAKPL